MVFTESDYRQYPRYIPSTNQGHADCDDLPADATPPWSTTACGVNVGLFELIIGDPGDRFLRIGDDSRELRAYYCRQDIFDPDCTGTQLAVYEIAGIGVVADTPVHQIEIYLFVGFSDGNPSNPQLTGKDMHIAIAETGVGFTEATANGADWIPGGSYTPSGWIPTDYHTFRVEKHVISDDETEVRLFVDNSAMPVVTLDYADLKDSTSNRAFMVTSTPGTSTFDVDYYRYRIGTTTFRTGANCAADLNNDDTVSTSDLLILFANWGACADCNDCLADIDDTCDSDCMVSTADLLFLLDSWGDCS
ncbi:MAG: hypothetical protein IH984_13950 [Planctomycetes bacterium]|nr:hypothetical protein [Planctomycetota bacterium]